MDIIEETIKVINEEFNIAPLNLDKDELISKLDSRIQKEYSLNEDLYNSFGDIELVSNLNNKLSIFIYRDQEKDNKISVTIGASGNREWFDNIDEIAEFINSTMQNYYKEQDELNS